MNILEKIELKHKNLNEIRFHGVQVWVYLRVIYYFHFLNKKNAWHGKKGGNILKKFHYFKSIFYGFTNWFNRYDTIIFSDSSQRKKINGKYYDKLMDAWADELPGKTLFVEMPNLNHIEINKVYSKHIVSRILLVSIINSLSLIRKKSVIKPISRIEYEFNIGIIHPKWINDLFSGIIVHKLLFRLLKPKRVFVSNYYWNIDVVLAAHDLGIIVAEPQHGVIGNNHFAFNTNHKFESVYFPDFMFLFGEDDEAIIKRNGNVKHAISVGHFFLDYVNNKMKPDKNWSEKLKKYNKRIIVSLQLENGLEVLEFIKKVAIKLENYCFVIAVRQNFQKNLINNFTDNVYFPGNLDCYQIAKLCDIHTSVYSTCVLETIALGLPNILIKIDERASIYYNDLQYVKVANDYDSYIKLIESENNINKTDVAQSAKSFIKPNYLMNVKNCVAKYFV